MWKRPKDKGKKKEAECRGRAEKQKERETFWAETELPLKELPKRRKHPRGWEPPEHVCGPGEKARWNMQEQKKAIW